MTVPDVDDLATLGGVMTDYAPVEDATCDMAAAFDNKVRANVAAMTQTADRAEVHFVTAAAGPFAATAHFSLWGNSPAVAPVITRAALGRFTITWPTSATDELGVAHTVNLVGGRANAQSTTFAQAQVVKTAANVVDVYLFDAAGAASDFVGTVLDVFVR
jgi:hypothetical protein